MGKIILSQSFIKAMNHGRELDELDARDFPECPAKAKAIYMDGMKQAPSMAMRYGNFMETLLFGKTGEGEVTDLPRVRGGIEKSAVQKRLEHQAWMLKQRWMPEMGMVVASQHPDPIRVSLGERYSFRARLDMYASMRDEYEHQEVFYPRTIVDLKVTQSIHNTYGKFKWGDAQNMDHTQAIAYSWAHAMKHKEWIPFYYVVVSHQKINEWIRVRVKVDNMKLNEFKTAMRRTVDMIDNYSTSGLWPKIPSNENCSGCPLRDRCEKGRIGAKTIIVH